MQFVARGRVVSWPSGTAVPGNLSSRMLIVPVPLWSLKTRTYGERNTRRTRAPRRNFLQRIRMWKVPFVSFA